MQQHACSASSGWIGPAGAALFVCRPAGAAACCSKGAETDTGPRDNSSKLLDELLAGASSQRQLLQLRHSQAQLLQVPSPSLPAAL